MMPAKGVSGPVIKLRCTSWGQLSALYERDLKRGMLFIRTTATLPLGKEARVDIIMPSGTVVNVEGRVAYLIPPGDRGPGIELVLTRFPPSAMWMIESALGKTPNTPSEEPSVDASLDVSTADAEEQLITALEGELRSFRTMHPHQVLGVQQDAGEAAARSAFAELSKKYHPDRFARFESDLARRVAADVFVVLREAYRRMADPSRRGPQGPAPTRHPTPARGMPRIPDDALPHGAGPPSVWLPTPTSQQRSTPPPPPAAASMVTFSNQRAPASPPPFDYDSRTPAAAPPSPKAPSAAALPRASDSPGLSADYLFGDLGPAPQAPQGPLALEEPRLVEADRLLESGNLDAALAAYEELVRQNPTHRAARAGRELVHGMRKIAAGDREGAAGHFEQALEIEPWSDRAARELATLRRAATERGKGLFAKLMRKGGGT